MTELYRRAMERCAPPKGMRERMEQNILASRPSQVKIFRPKGFRKKASAVLLAAALVFAMGTSAVALSPTLRELIFGTAGSFAPYVRPAESAVVTADGYELRVDSVVADHYLIVAYVEIRDLEGARLQEGMDVWGHFDQSRPIYSHVSSAVMGGKVIRCGEDGKTALAAVMEWGGQSVGDPSMTLKLLQPMECEIPFTLRYAPIRTIDLSGLDTGGVLPQLDRLELSPVGVNAVTKRKEDAAFENTRDHEMLRGELTVWFEDGSQRKSVQDGLFGSFDLAIGGWTFMDPYDLVQPEEIEPLDVEHITAISCRNWYLPINGDAAGPIEWIQP